MKTVNLSGGNNSSEPPKAPEADSSKKCPYCERKLADGASVCKYCRTPVDPATAKALPQTPEQLDAQFKRLKNTAVLFKALLALSVAALIISVLANSLVFIIAFILISLVLFMFYLGKNSILSDYIAGSVVLSALQDTFQNVTYKPDDHFDRATVSEAELIGGWNHIHGGDYISCEYRGLNLAMSDVKLTYEKKVNDKKTTTVVFKGRWMIFDFGKSLSANLILREKDGGMLNTLIGGGKSSVQTESEEFNDKFQIVTSDPECAFYVLTPNMMEYILATEKRTGGKFYMAFTGSRVHVAIDGISDSFERGASSAKSLNTMRNRTKSDIKLVLDIIEQLRLLNNIFSADDFAKQL